MKVMCIDNKYISNKRIEICNCYNITIGKWYDILLESDTHYKITHDLGVKHNYPKELFLTEKKLRKLKLKKINERY
jgi:hypothetical protein